MAYIPADAQWFLADLVESISVSGDPRIVVHVNSVLIRARTPKTALRKARALGRQANMTWKNAAGRKVTIRFLGLRELNVIHDKLEHGAEIAYRRRVVRSLEKARTFVKNERRLAVFAPGRASVGPDFVDAGIRAALKK
jgi:hypothetical protein